jgi:16S rRNA (adenine1518-N6/adenine1519-N6)-dimethyltransferase
MHAKFYDSPVEIRALLEREGIALKKRWGQNFLINKGAREKLLKLLDPQSTDYIWEIGAGLGAMTTALLAKVKELLIFEIDRGLIRVLFSFMHETDDHPEPVIPDRDQIKQAGQEPADLHTGKALTLMPGVKLIPGDFLKNWQRAAEQEGKPDKILGNLPYSSASAFILALLEADCIPGKMIFTIQKEMYQRMAASPGSKNYSSFSVVCQFACQIKYHGDLQPGSFYPEPGVVSSIMEMIPRHDIRLSVSRQVFFRFLHTLFLARRKTLKNNLTHAPFWSAEEKVQVLQTLTDAGYELQRRAEEFKVEDFVRMCETLAQAKLL